MRTIYSYLTIILIICVSHANAATYYSRASGVNFSGNTTWSLTTNGATVSYPGAAHSYVIQNGHTINYTGNTTVVGVTVLSGGTLAVTSSRSLTLTNPLVINNGGILSLANRVLTLGAGDITNSGSITGSTGGISRTTGVFTNTATGTVDFTGAAAITMGTGNFVNSNTNTSVNFGSGAITCAGTAQSVGGFRTTGRFTASNASGTITLTGDINSAGITKTGAGVLDMGAGRVHTSTGTIILTAGTMNGNSSTINVNLVSTTVWQGTATVFSPGNSTVNMGASGNQTLSASGTKTFYNLVFSGSGVKTNSSTTVNNLLTMQGTATASAAPTYGSSAGLIYNTSNNRTAGNEWPATFAGTQGVTINAMNITANNAKTFALNVPLIINTGATLTTGALAFTLGGDLINTGTWAPSSGDVTINLARVAQNIGRFGTSGLVTMSKPSGTATFTANVNGGALTMNGAGILDLGAGLTHVFSGAWTNTLGTLIGNSSILRIGGTTSGSGATFSAGSSTVDFNGTAAQIIPAFNYDNLTISGDKGGATITLATGTIGIASTFLPSASNVTYSVTGNTVAFNGGVQTIPSFTFNNVIFSGGNKTIQSNVTVKNLEIQTGPTMNINPPGILTIN